MQNIKIPSLAKKFLFPKKKTKRLYKKQNLLKD